MAFPVKDWHSAPDTTTPINAPALEDMETRLSSYTDAEVSEVQSGTVVLAPDTPTRNRAMAADEDGYAVWAANGVDVPLDLGIAKTMPAGEGGVRVDYYGGLLVGLNEAIKHTGGSGLDKQYINASAPDFYVSGKGAGRGTYTRSMSLCDVGDPPDLRMARFGLPDTESHIPHPPQYTYISAAATDTLTIAAGHEIRGGNLVIVVGDAGLPSGTYYARDVTATTLKVAATPGGAAVDVTVDGNGTVQGEPADYQQGLSGGASMGTMRWLAGVIPQEKDGAWGHEPMGSVAGTYGSSLQQTSATITPITAEAPYNMGGIFALGAHLALATRPQSGPASPAGKAFTAVAATDLFTSGGHGYVDGDRVMFGLAQAFTVAAATDTLTATAHGFSNGDRVLIKSLVTGGAGLSTTDLYYVINVTANTFQVSMLPPAIGSAIPISSDGNGTVEAHSTVAGGVNPKTNYYVRDAAADTFKIATTAGGTAVDVTAALSGTVRQTNVASRDVFLLHSAGFGAVLSATLQNNSPSAMLQGVTLTRGDFVAGRRVHAIEKIIASRPASGAGIGTTSIGASGPSGESAVAFGATGDVLIYRSATNRLGVSSHVAAGEAVIAGTAGKVGLYGITPVSRAAAIASPTADVTSLKTAVDAIRIALMNIGVTS